MQFKAMIGNHEITGECVNPGEWFGKCWIIGVRCGYSMFYYAIEADCESDAIDVLTDHEEFGKSIRMDSEYYAEQLKENPDDIHYAGNASEPVDLDNVMIFGKTHGHDTYQNLVYLAGEMTPEQYANRS